MCGFGMVFIIVVVVVVFIHGVVQIRRRCPFKVRCVGRDKKGVLR